ncbi:MAG: metal-sensitive transcriptional regulator [Candidatus Omnitrophica bacterium]|nr:metal-sensitive transcriptional regulator [Candidatus Omnitrophota bacterium]
MIDRATQADTLKRLAKIEGQIKGLQRMVEEGRYCIDIIHQITAVRRALEQVALGVMRRHVDSCVSEAIRSKNGQEKVTELMATIHQFMK